MKFFPPEPDLLHVHIWNLDARGIGSAVDFGLDFSLFRVVVEAMSLTISCRLPRICPRRGLADDPSAEDARRLVQGYLEHYNNAPEQRHQLPIVPNDIPTTPLEIGRARSHS